MADTKVRVPSIRDMDAETFALHIALRHPGLRTSFRSTRYEHDMSHRCLPSGFIDHEHREPASDTPEPTAEARASFWYRPPHP